MKLSGKISDRVRGENGQKKVDAEVNPGRPNMEGTKNDTKHDGHRMTGRGGKK